jgi:hypothetical protein
VLDAGVDNPQSDAPGLPDFKLWRFQAGVDGDDFASLRNAALGAPPDPVDDVLTVPITLGLRVRM